MGFWDALTLEVMRLPSRAIPLIGGDPNAKLGSIATEHLGAYYLDKENNTCSL